MAMADPLGVVKQPVAPKPVTMASNYSTPVAPTVAPRTLSPAETTQGQLQGMLAQNSQYLQAARGTAKRDAASRGMLGSSMAIESGEAAAIKAAAPIAAADASANAAAGLSAQEANQTMAGRGYEGAVTSKMDASKYNLESNLTAQKSTDTLALNQYLKQMDASTEMAKMAHDDKVVLAQKFADMDSENARNITAIEQSNISGKEQLIWDMNNNNAAAKSSIAKIMGINYSWSAGPSPEQVAADKAAADKAAADKAASGAGETSGGTSSAYTLGTKPWGTYPLLGDNPNQ